MSFHKLCLDMHVKMTKFERNGSLETPRVLSHDLYWENKTCIDVNINITARKL